MSIESDVNDLKKIISNSKSLDLLLILSIFLIPFLIGVFLLLYIRNNLKNLHQKRNDIIQSISLSLQESVKDAHLMLENIRINNTYLTYPNKQMIDNYLVSLLNDIDLLIFNNKLFSNDLNTVITSSKNQILEIQNHVNNYNQLFVERRLIEYDYLFNKSPFPLDENQKRAVIVDDKHNLIVAGAGSGKTEVLITRIAYLVERKPDTIDPERILALAFQNKAALEMRERLQERFGINVKIKTFHALGKEILEKSSDNPPKILFSGDNFEFQYNEFIKSFYNNLLKSKEFEEALINYLKFFGDEELQKDNTDFKEKQEYFKYMRELTYTALNGVKVKSEAERKVMNFFLTHSINDERIHVIYEKPAKWMSYLDEKGNEQIPKPDFFLPQYNLFLEYWAIDENGNVPEWFEGENPTEEYRRGMEFKKTKFQNQKLYGLMEICNWEFYSAEDRDQLIKTKLLEQLNERFPEKQFEIKPLRYEQIVQIVWQDCKESIRNVEGNIATFITIAKTYNLSPEDIKKRLRNEKWTKKQMAFGKLALILYTEYERYLRLNNYIDFSDMINLAVKALNQNSQLYKDVFDHILVDEYQDISAQRYELIKSLMNKNNDCKLFCVGDDWQSIMGFAGSNIDYFVNFENYFDHPARTDLTMNYRSTKPIVDLGATIISHNDGVQLQKETIALRQDGKRVNVVLFSTSDSKDYYSCMMKHCVDSIERLLQSGLYEPKDIMILARIKNHYYLNNKYNDYLKQSTEYEKLKNISYMSVHRSKGLQAKVVFILNVNDELYGFPCKIEDSKIFEPAIVGRRKDRLEEERRLFYVAVTRAKEEVIIYAQESLKSKFIYEISEQVDIKAI